MNPASVQHAPLSKSFALGTGFGRATEGRAFDAGRQPAASVRANISCPTLDPLGGPGVNGAVAALHDVLCSDAG
jgi:hypothetical protein